MYAGTAVELDANVAHLAHVASVVIHVVALHHKAE
jgi:hypothetical protein